MRLIDGDALENAIDKERQMLIEQERLGAEHIVVHHARRLIEDAPTIDAIPVEWLREKMDEADDAGDIDSVDMFSWIIQAWHKEQEIEELLMYSIIPKEANSEDQT